MTFTKDKSGKISFISNRVKIDDDIRCIYYGFELQSDTIYLNKIKDLPILANITKNTIEDCNIRIDVPSLFSTFFKDDFIIDNNKFPNKILGVYNLPKIFPMTSLPPFFIDYIITDKNELFLYIINFYFSYKGKDFERFTLALVGLPQINNRNNKVIESEFIKSIRPVLLSQEKTVSPIPIKNTAIIFKDKFIQAPAKDKIQNFNFYIDDINDLK